MLINVLRKINTLLPERLRLVLLPYYRLFFPNLTNIIFLPQIRCNYHCPYCIWNRFSPDEFKDAYYPYTDWIEVFKKFSPSAVIITGGEPFLYKDIVSLIEHFPRKHVISCVVTNLSVGVDKLVSLKNKEFRIMTSYHPEMTSKEAFVRNLLLLKEHGFRNVTINFVATPAHLKDVVGLKKYFEESVGFYFRVDTYKDPQYDYSQEEVRLIRELKRAGIIAMDRTEGYDFDDTSLKKCKAGRSLFLVTANGNVYSCMEGYFYSECEPYKEKYSKIDNFYLGNVFRGDFKQCVKDRICHSPCAELCDIELAGVRRLLGKEKV